MKVLIPSALRSYVEQSRVEASGATLFELVADLERHYPGLRFRMIDEQDQVRPHIRIFVNGAAVKDLSAVLQTSDSVHIVQALSGG